MDSGGGSGSDVCDDHEEGEDQVRACGGRELVVKNGKRAGCFFAATSRRAHTPCIARPPRPEIALLLHPLVADN